jgi:hypothetical protein
MFKKVKEGTKNKEQRIINKKDQAYCKKDQRELLEI